MYLDKLKKLQKLQNWGLRIVYNNLNNRLNETELHQEAGLTLLKYRHIMHLLSIIYHRSKNEKYVDARDLGTRQFDKIKLRVMNPIIKKAFKSPNYYGATLWDMLPRETQAEPTYNTFKYKVKSHIAAGMFNNV